VSYERYHKTLVPVREVRPHVKELVDRCGTMQAAARYALVAPNTIGRILAGANETMQKSTASKLMIALEHRRKEDRSTRRTHARLLKARQSQARMERTLANERGIYSEAD
jgi:hypothetical protein